MGILLIGSWHVRSWYAYWASKIRSDIMNYRYPAILAVFVVLIAVAIAGCTTSPNPPHTSTKSPSLAASTKPKVTASAPAVKSGWYTLGSMINLNKVHWFEYQMTSNKGGSPYTSKLRWDYNVDYQGKTANMITIASDTGSGDTATNQVMTYYTNVSSGAILGGHIKTTSGDQVIKDDDLDPDAAASAAPDTSTENPLLSYQSKSTANAGAESVIVPAGTYIAAKYNWLNGDTTGTVWMNPNVPIPVKISASSSGRTAGMELIGWG